jgi:hypothetical protein
MEKTIERINQIRQNGFELKFETVFEDAIENFKKIALYSGLLIFVVAIIVGFLYVIAMGYCGITIEDMVAFQEKIKKGLLSQQEFLYISLASLFTNCIIAPFLAGFYKMIDAAKKDISFNALSIFSYYKMPFLLQILIANFIVEGISVFGSMLLINSKHEFLSNIFSTIIMLFTAFVIPFIIFGKLNALQSIKASILIFSKKPLLIIALLIIGFIGSFIGLIGLCVGIFFYTCFYLCYKI